MRARRRRLGAGNGVGLFQKFASRGATILEASGRVGGLDSGPTTYSCLQPPSLRAQLTIPSTPNANRTLPASTFPSARSGAANQPPSRRATASAPHPLRHAAHAEREARLSKSQNVPVHRIDPGLRNSHHARRPGATPLAAAEPPACTNAKWRGLRG